GCIMNRKVLETIQQYELLKKKQTVVCATSGGADSMAMLVVMRELAKKLDISVAAAHFNHCLRGLESDRDEKFVEDYCIKNAIPFYSERADVKNEAIKRKKGIEETARELRYAFFERALVKLSADVVATAHTANDNLETMLINLLRGTGILGLCGIPPKRDDVIRPLIRVERREVEEYLREKGVDYITDSSNLTNEYLRNKIRNKIIPQLFEINPAIYRSARTAADSLTLDSEYILTEVYKLAEQAKLSENDITINAKLLSDAHPAVAGRTVRLLFEKIAGECGELTIKHAAHILSLCAGNHPSKKINLPCNITASRRYDDLVLIKNGYETSKIKEIALISDGKYDIYGTDYFIEYKKKYKNLKIYNLSHTFLIDCGKINGCLVVRSRKEGDTLALTGRRTRTLKKLFIDEKIPVEKRGLIPVIADQKRVVAVFGFGVDRYFEAKDPANALYLRIGRVQENDE
ncbi:MAG: tRNA lysidine(34) synthetase TilS, partial [Clostridiales bacterium]|nr:tRNA lysidine(34) synthetase TilS [Clostridiales bacterium]